MRLYLDANIFIYAMESESDAGNLARQVFREVETKSLEAVTSEIPLAEVLRGGSALMEAHAFSAYVEVFAKARDCQVVPVSRNILIGTARLNVERKIDLADSIHVSTALVMGCDALLIEDLRLPVPAGLTKLSLLDRVKES